MLKTFELFLRNLLIHMILNENVGNSLSCRIGSLENTAHHNFAYTWVHCRIGSLEIPRLC
ncbi:UNVERIFIED_ORG: hypothetical protein J2W64_003862 [Rahnella aquatilis]|nr:hypothetical protein [Rahnella aquatilis]